MKKNFAFIFILFYSIFLGQEFKIITVKDSILENKNYEIFEFINDKTQLENLKYLATISCEGEKEAFSNIYEIAKFQSQNLGANSFRFIKKEENGNHIKIFFDVYFADHKYLIENIKNEEENKIYIFGSDHLKEEKKRYYKYNGKLRTLPIGGFDVKPYELNSKIRLAKRDFMSPSIIIQKSKNFKSLFLNTDGWGQNDSRNYARDIFDKTIIVDINALYKFDKNLGYTLLEIKK